MATVTTAKVIRTIEKAGALLVFPPGNEREPPSLWYELYPRSRMRWDWGDSADDRVVDLWHLRAELSAGDEVVYAKWYRGRAVFFARPVFTALLKLLGSTGTAPETLPGDAGRLLTLLLDDSPQTPRMLRESLDLLGRPYESAFNRALKALWDLLLAVGCGEVDEGSYPSLAVGATRVVFEDLWDDAAALAREAAEATWRRHVTAGSALDKHLNRLIRAACRQSSSSPDPTRN
jgi:hypothetical protein